MIELQVSTQAHSEMIDVTNLIQDNIQQYTGSVLIYTPHTTAGITINEGADPDVQKDALMMLDRLVPWNENYKHLEGNSAAHIKAMLIGNSKNVIVEKGKMQLGTWERIFYCEFDGPRKRKIWLQLIK
jgi:secondary thiamine-phosphate synthase enzyme